MKKITIECENKEEKGKVLKKIHEQLKGNRDYIDSDIVLSDIDGVNLAEYLVTIYITEDVKEMPKIII